MKSITMNLSGAECRYDILIGGAIFADSVDKLLTQHQNSRLFVITNETINDFFSELINSQFLSRANVQLMLLPDGEKFKIQSTVNAIYDFLIEKKANRQSVLIAFGGGVIGDIVGFAAATFMRGIGYVQIPTTLLSQVDSSVGGKTGVNHTAGKNLIGAFKQPMQTIIDVDFLQTLSDREFISGYAELIKHGIIQDAHLFNLLKNIHWKDLRTDRDLLVEVVYRSCAVKASIVEADEKESYQRALLNFGHTIGHYLETHTNYELLSHGEAVIIGMDFAAWWSNQEGHLPDSDYKAIHEHLVSLPYHREFLDISEDAFLEIVEHDKKSFNEGIRFVGLKAIGQAYIFDKMTSKSLWNNFRSYLKTGTLSAEVI